MYIQHQAALGLLVDIGTLNNKICHTLLKLGINNGLSRPRLSPILAVQANPKVQPNPEKRYLDLG